MKALLKIVAEQNDIRPSVTSLTSFTTNLDIEDEVYSSYAKRVQLEPSKLKSRHLKDFNFNHFLLGNEWLQDMKKLPDRPPSYEDLLQ